jgi:hypothetical protein
LTWSSRQRGQNRQNINASIFAHSGQRCRRHCPRRGIGDDSQRSEGQFVLRRKPRHDVALHVCGDRARPGIERMLLCRALQRTIHAGNGRKLDATDCRPQFRGPCWVGRIAKVVIHDLATYDASPRPYCRRKPCGNAKADDGLGALSYFLADELLKPPAIPTTRNGSDLRGSRGDARLCAKTGRGDDEAWPLRLAAHIPTRTEVVLAAFRLR